jgi:hypothetical protein
VNGVTLATTVVRADPPVGTAATETVVTPIASSAKTRRRAVTPLRVNPGETPVWPVG